MTTLTASALAIHKQVSMDIYLKINCFHTLQNEISFHFLHAYIHIIQGVPKNGDVSANFTNFFFKSQTSKACVGITPNFMCCVSHI